MTPEQRRLREAHLARRALVRMLGPALGEQTKIYARVDNGPGAQSAGSWGEGAGHLRVDYIPSHNPTPWRAFVALRKELAHPSSGNLRTVYRQARDLTNIAETVRAAILATHGPEALP